MTFEELRARGFVPVRECSICGVPIGYRTHRTHVAAFYDPTCDCPGGGNERLISYDEMMRIPLPLTEETTMTTLNERIEAAKTIEPPPWQWFAAQPNHTNGWWVISTDPEGNNTVDESGDGGFEEETARFIAAAPDLHRLVLDLAAENKRLRKIIADREALE